MADRRTRAKRTRTPSVLGRLLTRTYVGRLLLYAVAATVVCGFDLLVTGDSLRAFYQLAGAEFLLFAAALWAVYLIRRVRD